MNSSNNAAASRPTGVVTPSQQLSTPGGSPRSVVNFLEAKTYAVEWADENGDKHRELMHFIGGQWYRAPNGENYAATLRPISKDSWLVEKLEDRRRNETTPAASVPKKDAVDVLK